MYPGNYTDKEEFLRCLVDNISLLLLQAIPEFQESAAQTDWKYPWNAAVQYEPREFDEKQKEEVEKDPELQESSAYVVPR